MIIDAILDRKDGIPYTRESMKYIYDSATTFNFDYVASAFDMGTNEDCQKALAKYIDENNYNESIKDYIYSKNWIV